MSHRLAGFLASRTSVSISDLVNAMTVPGFRVYTSAISYGNLRLARAIMHCINVSSMDSEDDWRALSCMSIRVQHRVSALGLQDHAVAIAVRDAVRYELSEPTYNLIDLACLVDLGDL